MTKPLLSLSLALAFSGCLAPEEEPAGEELTEAQVQELSAQTTDALRAATLMAHGFGSLIAEPPTREQEHLEEGQLPGGDATPVPMMMDGPMMGEGGEGGDDGGAASCTRLEWNVLDPLRLTAHFDACPQESGETLSGSASIYLRHEGDENSLGVDATLATESWSLDGFFVVTAEPGQLRFDTDIDYAGAEGATRLVLEGATVAVVGDALVLDGSGTLTVDGETWAADATSVTFDDATCTYPTGGSADLTIPNTPPITLLFAEEDGAPVVYAQVGVLPPIPYYPTC